MAKMFYTAAEAAERLGVAEDELTKLVRDGSLREFRDAGTIHYKVSDVDGLAPSPPPPPASDSTAEGETVGVVQEADASGGFGSDEILLEPAEDSSIELAPSAGDVISLDESAAAGTISGTTAAGKTKGDTVVPSVGVNVFDDDELDEHVDPLAQTAVTDLAGLGIDGVGSGSGILDLTRESDDTSLGRELLDEIYTPGGEGEAEEPVEVGEETRAGLETAADAETTDEDEPLQVEGDTQVAAAGTVAATTVVEYGPDAVSSSLTAAMGVAVAVFWLAGLSAAAMVRGMAPALIKSIYANLWMYAAGAIGAAAIAAGVTYMLAKRST